MSVTIQIPGSIDAVYLVSQLNLAGFMNIVFTEGTLTVEDAQDSDADNIQTIVTNDSQSPANLQDYQISLQKFLDQTAVDRGYQSKQDCLNGIGSQIAGWAQDAATMQAYADYCWQSLMGVFGYANNSRLPGDHQMNPTPPPSIDDFLNSTLNSISW